MTIKISIFSPKIYPYLSTIFTQSRCFLSICLVLLWVMPVQAAWQPGFKSVGIWEIEEQLRLDLAIWYPTRRPPTRLDYNDWVFEASRGAVPIPGQHPLILLSHPSSGSRFSQYQLASSLAQSGFVVVTPTHSDDNLNDMTAALTLTQFFSRTRELSLIIDYLQKNHELSSMIDFDRIGLLGLGAGGTAALLLAGGIFSNQVYNQYCQDDTTDPYCLPWAKDRLNWMLNSNLLNIKQHDPRFKAIFIVEPTVPMLFTKQSLAAVTIPTQIAWGKSEYPRFDQAKEYLANLIPQAEKQLMTLSSLAALTSECSNTLQQNLPEICLGVSKEDRQKVQKELAMSSLKFFLQHLGQPSS